MLGTQKKAASWGGRLPESDQAGDYFLNFFLAIPARPIRPLPRSIIVPGSGTGAAPTVIPCQYSSGEEDQLMLEIKPLNWSTP